MEENLTFVRYDDVYESYLNGIRYNFKTCTDEMVYVRTSSDVSKITHSILFENDNLYYGCAFCSIDDNFIRKIGNKLATDRSIAMKDNNTYLDISYYGITEEMKNNAFKSKKSMNELFHLICDSIMADNELLQEELDDTNEVVEDNFINESGLEFTNISTEEYRTYEFAGGEKVTINNPSRLNVSQSGGHRIFDREGISHYIPPKWKHLYWKSFDGEPNFVK